MKHIAQFLFFFTLVVLGKFLIAVIDSNWSNPRIYLYGLFWSALFALATIPAYVIARLIYAYKNSLVLSSLIFVCIVLAWRIISVVNSGVIYPNNPYANHLYVIKYSAVELLAFLLSIWLFQRKRALLK